MKQKQFFFADAVCNLEMAKTMLKDNGGISNATV